MSIALNTTPYAPCPTFFWIVNRFFMCSSNLSTFPSSQNIINKNNNIKTNIQTKQEINYEQIPKQNNLNNSNKNISTINNYQNIHSAANKTTKTIAYQKVKVYYKDEYGNILYIQEELRPILDESSNNNNNNIINNNYNQQNNYQTNQNDYNTSNVQISEDKKYKVTYQENRDISGLDNNQNQNYINDTYNNQCYSERDIYGKNNNDNENNNIKQQENDNYQRTNRHMEKNNENQNENNNIDELPVIPENKKRKRPVYKITENNIIENNKVENNIHENNLIENNNAENNIHQSCS